MVSICCFLKKKIVIIWFNLSEWAVALWGWCKTDFYFYPQNQNVISSRNSSSTMQTWILSHYIQGIDLKKNFLAQSASELYRPSDRRLSVKLVPTYSDSGCRVVSATDPHGRILDSLDRSHYLFFQVAPQLYSRGWVDSVPEATTSQKIWQLDLRGGLKE
jgi:hypothetical protein